MCGAVFWSFGTVKDEESELLTLTEKNFPF
jgi:hypothetical protein